MRVLIAGVDGYLGWPLALHLRSRGHEVAGIDAGLRRQWVAEVASDSAIAIASMASRLEAAEGAGLGSIEFREGNLCDYNLVEQVIREFQPEAIVHLGEMPSAPYSMIDAQHAIWTHQNNLEGTLNLLFAMREHCREAHLVKLGTMGEYGTPNVVIPEGFFEIEYRGRTDRLPFPRQAGSWYHQTKVHDSNNVMFACKIWGLRSTDIMQGVVYGARIDAMGDDPRLQTRLDFDGCFGTAINRFSCQAVVGHPLTPYGSGGQKRGFLPLRDSMQCFTLAVENPAAVGEYRVFNQFENVYNVTDLANLVKDVGQELGLSVDVRHAENPRIEAEDHFYEPDHSNLLDLGYQPTTDMKSEVRRTLEDLMPCRDRIAAHADKLLPSIRWDGGRQQVGWADSK